MINTLGRLNKFFVYDWFSKTIIKENKDKVGLLANTILDKFLREIVILNIISLTKTRKVISRKNNTTNYNNHYSAVNNIIDILNWIQLLVEDNVFKE